METKKETTKTLVKGTIFTLLFLALVLATNLAYKEITLNKTEEYRQEQAYQEFLKNSPHQLDYAIFGDSHLMLGLNPQYLPNSFNFASVGENYISTYYKVERVLGQDRVKVDHIILPLDLQTFSSFFVDKAHLFPQPWLYAQFTPLTEMTTLRNDGLTSLWLDAHFPFIANGEAMMGDLLIKKSFHPMHKGWFNYSDNFSASDKEAFSQKKYSQFFEGQHKIDDLPFSYFLKTIALAEQKNATIIFVRMPHSKEYNDLVKNNSHDAEGYYGSLFQGINTTITKPYFYLDYYSLFFNNSDVLKDPDHVNYRGAEIVTKRLYTDLQKRNLISPRKP